jgi:F-type H+-transporting ATPase subunit epsilon
MKRITLEIITQERHLLSKTVDKVVVPSISGELTILPGHVPLFTRLSDGIVLLFDGTSWDEFGVLGGFLDVGPNSHVTIMADSALRAEDVNEAKALEAKRQAEEAMKQKDDMVAFRIAEGSLRQALLELKVARRSKRRDSSFTSNQ